MLDEQKVAEEAFYGMELQALAKAEGHRPGLPNIVNQPTAQEMEDKIIRYVLADEWRTCGQIAEAANMSKPRVHPIAMRLAGKGLVVTKKMNRAAHYRLAK